MPLVRVSVACLVALTCLGSSHTVVGARIPGNPAKPKAALSVEICFGEACGPKLGRPFPQIAKQAGTITASGAWSFKCPGTCEGTANRPVTVTLRAVPSRDGRHDFDHWEKACARAGTVRTCTVPVEGATPVKAVFKRYG